ncbi:hypothetical protein M422DRAFT_239336 [Sphaerobolus stellatus SS14]|nr:hypothetical protein M422DRAFT_239336 [Sphaerobolus stellatus SS14]
MPSIPQEDSSGIPTNIATIFGPYLIGLALNWCLFGVLSNQLYLYYLSFPKDSKYLKILVYGLYMLEIAQTCILMNDAWKWFIAGWGHVDRLQSFYLEWFNVPILDGFISSVVQLFFAWRIWIISNTPVVAGLIMTLVFIQFSGAVATGIELKVRSIPAGQVRHVSPAVSVWLSGTAAVDILIAVSMIYLLTRHKACFSHTKVLVSRLCRLSIETGSVTATIAGINYHTTPAFVLAKLYSNTLMAVLNNRLHLRRDTSEGTFLCTGLGVQNTLQDHTAGITNDLLRESMAFASPLQAETAVEFDNTVPRIDNLQLRSLPNAKIHDYDRKERPVWTADLLPPSVNRNFGYTVGGL